MKLLIAGGGGYIGSALVPALLERGYEVDVVDKLWFGNHLPAEVHVRETEILELTEDDLEKYDQVIFLAGLSNDPMAEFAPSQNFIYNAAAPAYLGYIARKANVKRFIYAGSCSVYGYTLEDELCNEESPTVSNFPYSLSKLQGETSILQLADDKFSAIALRQGTVSGYSPRMRLDLVVNTMLMTAVKTGEIVVNNPTIVRPVLSIHDAVNGYIRAIEAPEKVSGVFNIASGNYTIGEIGDIVIKVAKAKLGIEVQLTTKHQKEIRNYRVSIEKVKKTLGFIPQSNVEQIVEDLIENLDKFSDFENPSYYNIKVLKSLLEHKPDTVIVKDSLR